MDAPRILRCETPSKTRFDRIDRARAVLMLTCSPLEVHGPHLPLGVDAPEGDGLAERMLRFLFLNPLMIRLANWGLGLRNPIA